MIAIAIGITATLILLGYLWSKGQAKIPFVTKKSQSRPEDWGSAEHKWEISNKTGIYYCNVNYFDLF